MDKQIDYKELYKRRMEIKGKTPIERNFNNKLREFRKYFNETLNKYEVIINDKRIAELVIQDHSQSNNKDLSDDKYIIAPLETEISVGDYIKWDGVHWLVFSEEHKTIQTHQQAKIKTSNECIKWIRNGEIVNNGIGWYSYSQSQTLYTMGVKDTKMMSVPDSNFTIYMQNNPDTRDLRMGERIFVGRRVYKINFIDDVSREGLINYLLSEDTISPYDNEEKGIADYYKYYDKEDDVTNHIDTTEKPKDIVIHGEKNPKISRTYKYESTEPVDSWIVETLESFNQFEIVSKNNKEIVIKFRDDPRFIGQEVAIKALSGKSMGVLTANIAIKY